MEIRENSVLFLAYNESEEVTYTVSYTDITLHSGIFTQDCVINISNNMTVSNQLE